MWHVQEFYRIVHDVQLILSDFFFIYHLLNGIKLYRMILSVFKAIIFVHIPMCFFPEVRFAMFHVSGKQTSQDFVPFVVCVFV